MSVSKRTINATTGFHIRVNLYILRYFWKHLRNQEAWEDVDMYSLFGISRQRYGRMIGGENFYLPSGTVNSICSQLAIDPKYLTVAEGTGIPQKDRLIHIEGLKYEDWQAGFNRLLTVEANERRREEDKASLGEPEAGEIMAIKTIKNALNQHVANGYIQEHYDNNTPLFRICYYFSKRITYSEGEYAKYLMNELKRLKVQEWKQAETDSLKEYKEILSEHLEYINAQLVIKRYEIKK